MTLRWRLTLYFTLVSAFMLALAGLGFYVSLHSSLNRSLDDSLIEAASLAASQLSGDGEAPSQFSSGDAQEFDKRLRGVTSLLLYSSKGQLTDHFGPKRAPALLEVGFSNAQDQRYYTLKLDNGEWVQAVRSSVETSETLSNAQRLFLLGLPVLLLLGLAGGYWLADRALRPVDAVSRLASDIAKRGSTGERVPLSPGSDEMARLTQTVNAMLERLEQTLERERAFALSAAHELRTPLSLLIGRLGLALERERKPEDDERTLVKLLEVSHDLSGTVERLLALARSSGPLIPQSVDLEVLALETAERLSPSLKGHSVTLHLELERAQTSGDALSLSLALNNLLENALKYGAQGGHLWLTTSQAEDEARLEVRDDGPGVPDGDLERLIRPFQRGTGMQGVPGSGLGLALVSALCEQHGGRLELGRAREGGLSACMVLPTEAAKRVSLERPRSVREG